MHEFSISSEMVNTILDTAKKNNAKNVISILLEIGELTLLNTEQVGFWIRELLKGSLAEDAEINIKVIKAKIHCRSCGYKGDIKQNQKDFFKHFCPQICPECNSFQIKVEKGRECTLRKIQIVK
jgi:hydrogenase nickel incorporation protein HypA/HybF